MENISLHIEYLLLKHDCVIVPGIGALINAYRGARYDSQHDIFLPPAAEVRFNSEITEDDGLLANSYSRKYRLPFAEARAMVKTETTSLRDALERDGEITLGNLGILSLDAGGILSFRPFSRMDTINDRLGFRPIGMAEPAKTDKEPAVAVVEEKEQSGKPARKLDFEKNYYIPVNKIFAKAAASLLLIATIAISLLLPSSDKVKEDRASVLPVDTLIKKAKSNISNCVVSAATEEFEDSAITVEQPTHGKEVSPEELPYQLIVGTFSSEAEALSYVKSMKGKGYELRDIPSKRLHRVSAAGAETSAELYSMLNDKEFKKRFSEAWIWCNPEKL